jgi:hypothetical protein
MRSLTGSPSARPRKKGGAIRAGEKGQPIVLVDRFIKEETNKEGQTVFKRTGENVWPGVKAGRCDESALRDLAAYCA